MREIYLEEIKERNVMMDGVKRIIDKTAIPTVNILCVDIAAINMDWLLDFTTTHIKELSGNYMCVSNVHTTIIAFEDEEYRAIQNNAVLAIPDGGPLSSVGHKRGAMNMSRTTGPSYLGEILKHGGYRHFFMVLLRKRWRSYSLI